MANKKTQTPPQSTTAPTQPAQTPPPAQASQQSAQAPTQQAQTAKIPDNTIKDPKDWTTGDEPMTGAQRSYLHTLAGEAHEQAPPDDITKAEASEKIEELQHKTGRG